MNRAPSDTQATSMVQIPSQHNTAPRRAAGLSYTEPCRYLYHPPLYRKSVITRRLLQALSPVSSNATSCTPSQCRFCQQKPTLYRSIWACQDNPYLLLLPQSYNPTGTSWEKALGSTSREGQQWLSHECAAQPSAVEPWTEG